MKIRFNLKDYVRWCLYNNIVSYVTIYDNKNQEAIYESNQITWITWTTNDDVSIIYDEIEWNGVINRYTKAIHDSMSEYVNHLIQSDRDRKINKILQNTKK